MRTLRGYIGCGFDNFSKAIIDLTLSTPNKDIEEVDEENQDKFEISLKKQNSSSVLNVGKAVLLRQFSATVSSRSLYSNEDIKQSIPNSPKTMDGIPARLFVISLINLLKKESTVYS